MERQTVDFGIDLGTTNSVIARATQRGVKVISNRLEGDITPSVVAISSQGQILVGQDALDKPDISPSTQFKRLMGTTNRIKMADGSKMSPDQLSAEVLKELKASVQLRYDMQPEYVVITVPAMFQQPQCEATHRAAELAGLKAVMLLQEPIAAATAYLNDEPEDGNYLVYDLGGGTFDVSIVSLKDGEMTVRTHGGDNYLGGADFDRKVFEWTVNQLERKFGPSPQLQKPPLRHRLLKACEEARKRLSIQENTYIDLGDFSLPTAQVSITQATLEDLIEEYITRTLQFTQERLNAADLTTQDINCVLLVGGPTRTPYIRRRLKEELGIPLSFEPNPMTVVATGAAIHASSLLKPDRAAKGRAHTTHEANLELYYEPVSTEYECSISGKIVAPTGFTGEIRIARTSGDWDTGWMPLHNGAFVGQLLLGKDTVTDFRLTLRDMSGTLWTVSPTEIAIRYGVAAARPVAPYNYSVAINDGSSEPIVKQGKPLPTYGIETFAVAKSVPAGSDEDLAIYFLEGHSRIAKDNIKVGELHITGQDLTRTLREGEKVEIRIHMDESRRLKARVSIPIFDLDYAVDMLSFIDKPPLSDLEASIIEAQHSIQSISELGEFVIGADHQKTILRSMRELEQLEADLADVEKGAIDEPERLAKKIADVKAEVSTLSQAYGIPAQYHKTMHAIDLAVGMAREFDDSIGIATTEDLRSDAEKCLRLEDTRGLEVVEQRADDIFWKHYIKTDRCWIGWVEYLRERRDLARDGRMYHEYLKNAEDCLRSNDREGVRWNVKKALEYLPDDEARLDRFYDAGLRRI